MSDEEQKEAQEAAQATETDTKARKMGWVSQDEWKGAEDKWRPAAEFVERGENIVPILKDRLDKMEADYNLVLKSNANEIKQIKQQAYDDALAKFESETEALEVKELQAFDEGDTEGFKKIKKDQKALKEPVKPKVVETAPAESVVFVDWAEKNKWYKDDSLLQRNANMIGEQIQAANPGIDETKFYGMVEAQIREEFPDKFTNPNRQEAASVEGGAGSPQQEGQAKFADLPKAAKDQFTRLAAKMKEKKREYTKEQFLAAYNE
jgi:hypothetical protein